MENRKMVPEIRFSGFTDPWEQHKLREMTVYRNGTVHEDKQSDKGEYELINLNSVSIDGGLKPSGRFIDEANDTLMLNDLVMVLSDVGHGDLLGRVAIIPENNRFVLNQRVALLRPNEKVYPKFLAVCINAHQKYFKLNGAGSSQLNISKDTVENFEPNVPKLPEQKIIARYFEQLDNLITLHQRKLEKLKTFKKAMLDKMFPKNGELVPEIRFSGFTDPWEQRKAIDIADYLKGNGYSKGDLTEAGTPIILYGRLYTNYQFAISEVDTFAVPRNGAVYSQGNEVIVPASGETAEDIARASAVEKSGVLLGGDLNILRPFDFMDPLFLALAISNGEPQKELAKKAQGKSVVHIHNSDIQEVTIAYPSRTEQDRIGSVFRLLDHRITLHQRKLEKLKNIKKSMLNKMFI